MAGGDRRIEVDIIANDDASRVFTHVASSMNSMSARMNNGITSLNQGLGRYNNAMAGMYRTTQIALMGAGYLFYRFTKDSIKAFADFEKQHGKTMGAIVNNYDKTAVAQAKFLSDQKRLKEESLTLGTVGPDGKGSFFNPTQVSYAQTALAKAGVSPDKMSAEMPTILKFAGGNDLSIETATEYAVNISEMFKIPSEKWKEMLDKVTRASDISTVDVTDIFETLKYAGPTASALGRSLDETLAMIAVMGNAGLKGSIAGTGINAFYTKLLSPIGKSEKAMDSAPTEFSKNVLEAFIAESVTPAGKFKSTVDVTAKLEEAMTSLDDREQAWFAQKLFGIFQMKAGYVLAANGGNKLADVAANITDNSPGSNDNKWAISIATSWGKQQAALNAWQGTKTDIGYRMAPITNVIADSLFASLTSKGLYKFDFSTLRKAIDDASVLMGEQYGSQVQETFRNAGKTGANLVQTMGANSPLLGGYAQSFAQLIGGDITGSIATMGKAIDEANNNIDLLPPDLRTMGREVRNAVVALGTLTAINFGTRLLENVTTIWRYTIGAVARTATMQVAAGTVTLMSTGLLGPTGQPIYRQGGTGGGTVLPGGGGSTGRTIVEGGGGGGAMVVGANGRVITPAQPTGGPLVDRNGNVLSTGSTAPVAKTGILSKIGGIGGALNMATWGYAIAEMTGINDKILDGLGVQGQSRKNADKGRTAINYGLTANMVDTFLLRGAVKSAIKKVFTSTGKFIVDGAAEGVPIAVDAVGVEATAVGGLLIAPMAALLVKGMTSDLEKKKQEQNLGKEPGALPGDQYMTDGKYSKLDPNGIFKDNNIVNVDKTVRDNANNTTQLLIQHKTLMDRIGELFGGGTPLNGGTPGYNAPGAITPDVLSAFLRGNVPPTVNVGAPNVKVDVNVDKSGNVTTSQYITKPGGDIGNEYRLTQSRVGAGAPIKASLGDRSRGGLLPR